jgi:hypothetical protein
MHHASRDIRFEFNYSGSQFWFLQPLLSLANPVLPTEIIICRFADEWGVSPPPPPPPPPPHTHTCSAAPVCYTFRNEDSFNPGLRLPGILYMYVVLINMCAHAFVRAPQSTLLLHLVHN